MKQKIYTLILFAMFIALIITCLSSCKKEKIIHRYPDGWQVMYDKSKVWSYPGVAPLTIKGLYTDEPKKSMNYYIVEDALGHTYNNIQDDVLINYVP